MSLKKLIQAGAGMAALLGAAGTAHALEVKVTKIAATTAVDFGAAPKKYASEMQQGTTAGANNDRDETVIEATFEANKGNFPSGNVVLTATLSGAKFDAAVVGSNVDFTGCGSTAPIATASLSSGGAEGDTTVSWVVSNLNACDPSEIVTLSLPIDLDLGGAGVSLKLGVVTESGNVAVDGGESTVSNFLVPAQAYVTSVVPAGNSTAIVAATGGAYFEFTGNTLAADLGTVELSATASVAIDLSGAIVDAADADYDTASIVVAGDLSAFNGTGDIVSLGSTAASSKTAGTATFSATEGASFGGVFTAATTIAVTTDGTAPMPASAYTVTVTPTLDGTGLTISPTSVTLDLASIVRDGTSVKLPWVVSGTQAGPDASNTNAIHYIRVTNPTAADYGKVTATVLSSSQSASVGKSVQLAASVAKGAELLVNSVALEPLLGSNFGRGDIEINVEGKNAIVVQLVARPDGVYTIDNQN